MRIKLACAACGYVIRVPPSYAGKKGKCPGCKEVVRIPSEPAPDAVEKPVAPRSVERPRPRASEAPTLRLEKPLVPGGEALDVALGRGSAAPSGMRDLASRGPEMGSGGEAASARDEAKAAARKRAPARPASKPPGGPRAHVFARLGAEPIRLQEGVPLTIGRSQDCDLTIPSPRVSRKHAQLTWRGGRALLKDLGSQNGTNVNGAPIAERLLEDGDEVLIGPFLITYLSPEDGEGLEGALDMLVDSEKKTEFTLVDAMAGRIEEVTVFEVLQTLEFNRKRGTLEVSRPDGATGRIGVDAGCVVFARLGQLEGMEAIHAVLEWDRGTFRLKPKLSEPATLKLPITGVLLDAGRRLDERGG